MPIRAPAAAVAPMMTGPAIQLPATPWSISFDFFLLSGEASNGRNGGCLFSLGYWDVSGSGTNVLNRLLLSWHDIQTVATGVWSKSFFLCGTDQAGNEIGNLVMDGHLGALGAIRGLTPGGFDQVNPDTQHTAFIVWNGVQLLAYMATAGQDVHVVARGTKTWAGFASAVPLYPFSTIRTDGSGGAPGRGFSMGRFCFANQAYTLPQMRRIAKGANPATLLGLAAPSLYWPLANTTAIANGATIPDAIQGANLTAVASTWQGPAGTTLTAEPDIGLAVDCPWTDFVYQPDLLTGGVIALTGSYSTANTARTIAVQMRAVDSAVPATVIVDWQTVVANVGGGAGDGTWSGNFAIDAGQRWMRWEIRPVVNGVPGASTVLSVNFGVGVVLLTTGQSIVKIGLGIDGSGGATHGYHSVYMPTPCSTTDGDQNFKAGSGRTYRAVSGIGMNRLAGIVADALGCCVMTSCPAKSGASIGAFLSPGSDLLEWAIYAANYTGARAILWNQGNSITPATGNSYYDDLEALYLAFVAGVNRPFTFLVMPVGNEFNTAQSSNTLTQYRRQQIHWVRESAAKGRDVLFAGSIMDLDLVDTTHPRNTLAGNGRMSARLGQSFAHAFNRALRSGVGPTITACIWDGAQSIKVKVLHNGGTALKSVVNFNNTNMTTYPEGVGPINNGQPLTGWAVGQNLARDVGGSWALANGIGVTALITGGDEITLTLASTPTSAPYVAYLEGKPGFSGTAVITAIENLVYDNRVSPVSPSLGFPLELTAEPVRCIPAYAIASGATGASPGGVTMPITAGWGVHSQKELVTVIR